MNAEIISIGTELLLGEIDDTNATYLARQMKAIGLNLYYRTTVGDNEGRIADIIRLALSRADIIITTGGLGPTVDDVTRQGIAAAVGQSLVFRPELMEQIKARFARFNTTMTENNRLQAMIPERAIAVENPVGTAPAFIVETDHGAIISLPGVPHEMKHLMENRVIPYLRERLGTQGVIKLRVLRTAGIGESWLGEQIADLMQLSNPTVGTAAHGGQTDVRITAKAPDETTADLMIADVEAQLRARIGDYVFGLDKEPIEGALFDVLRAANRRLIICEAGTDETIYKRLSKQPGSAGLIAHHLPFDNAQALGDVLHLSSGTTSAELIKAIQAAYPSPDKVVVMAFIVDPDWALLAGPDRVVIAVGDEQSIRERRYDDMTEGYVPWLSGWAIGIAWRMLREQTDQSSKPKS